MRVQCLFLSFHHHATTPTRRELRNYSPKGPQHFRRRQQHRRSQLSRPVHEIRLGHQIRHVKSLPTRPLPFHGGEQALGVSGQASSLEFVCQYIRSYLIRHWEYRRFHAIVQDEGTERCSHAIQNITADSRRCRRYL